MLRRIEPTTCHCPGCTHLAYWSHWEQPLCYRHIALLASEGNALQELRQALIEPITTETEHATIFLIHKTTFLAALCSYIDQLPFDRSFEVVYFDNCDQEIGHGWYARCLPFIDGMEEGALSDLASKVNTWSLQVCHWVEAEWHREELAS